MGLADKDDRKVFEERALSAEGRAIFGKAKSVEISNLDGDSQNLSRPHALCFAFKVRSHKENARPGQSPLDLAGPCRHRCVGRGKTRSDRSSDGRVRGLSDSFWFESYIGS